MDDKERPSANRLRAAVKVAREFRHLAPTNLEPTDDDLARVFGEAGISVHPDLYPLIKGEVTGQPLVRWAEEGQMYVGPGNTGGDVQVGQNEYERRFVHHGLGAVVTVVFYPVTGDGSDPMISPEPDDYGVQRSVSYVTCRDTTKPYETETGTVNDIRYRAMVDGGMPTAEAAEQWARELCETFTPDLILWDGKTTDGREAGGPRMADDTLRTGEGPVW